jgi:hypothetical protein
MLHGHARVLARNAGLPLVNGEAEPLKPGGYPSLQGSLLIFCGRERFGVKFYEG